MRKFFIVGLILASVGLSITFMGCKSTFKERAYVTIQHKENDTLRDKKEMYNSCIDVYNSILNYDKDLVKLKKEIGKGDIESTKQLASVIACSASHFEYMRCLSIGADAFLNEYGNNKTRYANKFSDEFHDKLYATLTDLKNAMSETPIDYSSNMTDLNKSWDNILKDSVRNNMYKHCKELSDILDNMKKEIDKS